MQEILKKLNELIGVCEARVKKVESERSELAALRGTLNAQGDSQDSREKDIQAQLVVLNKKKLLIKTIEEAQQMLTAAAQEGKQLRAQKEQFETQKEEHIKKMKDELGDIQRQKEKCSAMNAETEKKAANYKIQVMDEILKNSISKAVNS